MVWSEKFVFFGSHDFSRRILAGLLAGGQQPALVISTISKPSGRKKIIEPTPVEVLAKNAQLPFVSIKSFKQSYPQELTQIQANFAILAAFNRLLPKSLLQLFPLGVINVHPSLLPLYRGPSPIQQAILDEQAVTGVTLIILDEEMDHGPIIAQEQLSLNYDDALTLFIRTADLAVNMLKLIVPDYLAGKIKPQIQDHSRATYTSLITKKSGQADFSWPAKKLDNMRRAYTPWPGLWTTWQGSILKFIKTTVSTEKNIKPGQVIWLNNSLLIGCGQNTALQIIELQQAGGRPQTAKDFINGHRSFLRTSLPS